MSVTPQQFKNRYPAFADESVYPSATVQAFLSEAELELNCCVFGAYYDQGVMLHCAHYLSLETAATTASVAKGTSSGFAAVSTISSASVGDVSVTKDMQSVSDVGGIYGNLPATYFGQRLITLIKKLGAGAFVMSTHNNTQKCAPTEGGVCL